jgi:hypothetical protein
MNGSFQPTGGLKFRSHLMVIMEYYSIFTSVFHRILDFKNGAGFSSKPLFFYVTFNRVRGMWECDKCGNVDIAR